MAIHPKAKQVHDWLQSQPRATVAEIAAEHGMTEAETIELLEGHVVEAGVVRKCAPGGGGGWVPPPKTDG